MARPGRGPDVSLIIASRHRGELLADTVESILAGERLPSEIVIVDQSDAPHPTLAGAGSRGGCAIRYEHSRTVGLCRARNIGIGLARNEILVFTDDDMIAPPTWLGALVEALRGAGERGAVTGRVEATAPERPGAFQVALRTDREPAVFAGRIGRDVLAGGNMALFGSAIAEIGPFDEGLGAGAPFPAADDNDFGHRLLEAGYRILYVPEAVLYHRAWRAPEDYLTLRWGYGLGQGGFYAKHLRLRDPYIPLRLGRQISHYMVRLPWRLVRHHHRARGDLVFLGGLVAGLARGLRHRSTAR